MVVSFFLPRTRIRWQIQLPRSDEPGIFDYWSLGRYDAERWKMSYPQIAFSIFLSEIIKLITWWQASVAWPNQGFRAPSPRRMSRISNFLGTNLTPRDQAVVSTNSWSNPVIRLSIHEAMVVYLPGERSMQKKQPFIFNAVTLPSSNILSSTTLSLENMRK